MVQRLLKAAVRQTAGRPWRVTSRANIWAKFRNDVWYGNERGIVY